METDGRWVPFRGPVMRKMFRCHDGIVILSLKQDGVDPAGDKFSSFSWMKKIWMLREFLLSIIERGHLDKKPRWL